MLISRGTKRRFKLFIPHSLKTIHLLSLNHILSRSILFHIREKETEHNSTNERGKCLNHYLPSVVDSLKALCNFLYIFFWAVIAATTKKSDIIFDLSKHALYLYKKKLKCKGLCIWLSIRLHKEVINNSITIR